MNWFSHEEDLLKWLESKNYCKTYFKSIISNLRRHVKVISTPMDVIRAFTGLTNGQRHCLNRAFKALFNFLEIKGFNKNWLDTLRKAVPKDELGIDLRIPSESEIITSLRQVSKTNQTKYKATYNMALDSGLRLTEIVRFIKNFNSGQIQKFKGIYIASMGYFRRSKLAYYGFFTENTMATLQSLTQNEIQNLKYKAATTYFRKNAVKVIPHKYLRKFAFDKMIELEVPESVADFVEGRTPKSIGARHYMALLRQAKRFYPRYAEYMTLIREKAGLSIRI